MKLGLFLVSVLVAAVLSAEAQSRDSLAEGFVHPPESAKPLTFWHWINGCVSKEGITRDLESFKRAGLGGVQHFTIGGGEAILDDPSVQVLNPKWRELMTFAIDECARLGLSFGTHNCPGWSSSGGPSVKVEQSMQKLVWTATEVAGPTEFSARLPRAEFDPRWNYYSDIAVLAVPAEGAIARSDVVDLTAALKPEGQLAWTAPAGKWTILRFGHTTTGQINGTAPLSGQGLECDKMSQTALEAFWSGYPSEIIKLAGPNAGTTLTRLEIDSYEAGSQDWTPKMREEFRTRRGYDLLPWLPVLAKRTVENAEMTARFRHDWRQTITELFAENYYGHITELAHRTPGLKMLIEPYNTGRFTPFDPLGVEGPGDLLACEFWEKPAQWGWDSVKPVASAVHRTGKGLVLAESFTGQPLYAWRQDPFVLKSTGDRAYCAGVNQLILHSSAHNPWPAACPGMTMGFWGTQFGPGQTWWEHGGPEWIAYLTRCQFLLQQGVFAGDFCYLLNSHGTPKIPTGYDGDAFSERDLIDRLEVTGGHLTLPDGVSYRALVLPAANTMSPKLAAKIQQLVKDGATVIGSKPERASGLENYPACDQEVARTAGEVWGASAEGQERTYGSGRIVWGKKPEEVLAEDGVGPDVQFEPAAPLLWIHRRIGARELYFLSNQTDEPVSETISFRVEGSQPEFWDAATGEIRSAETWAADCQRTKVHLSLDPSGSIFVVFAPSEDKASPPAALPPPIATLPVQGPWELRFPPNEGAPEKVSLPALTSWSENMDPGVKYFSGTATYVKEIDVPSDFLAPRRRVTIDVGRVKNIATISLNGRAAPALWKPPFRADITESLHSGNNHLEIRVTNLWPNRFIGDEQQPNDCEWAGPRSFNVGSGPVIVGQPLLRLPAWFTEGKPRPSAGRYTFTTFKFFTKDSPLLESGLLGPVTLQSTGEAKTLSSK